KCVGPSVGPHCHWPRAVRAGFRKSRSSVFVLTAPRPIDTRHTRRPRRAKRARFRASASAPPSSGRRAARRSRVAYWLARQSRDCRTKVQTFFTHVFFLVSCIFKRLTVFCLINWSACLFQNLS